MRNNEYKKQMLNVISMYDHTAENFLKKLHDEGIRIAMVDAKGEPLKDKYGNQRYNTYYGRQPTTRRSRYALFGAEAKKEFSSTNILEFTGGQADHVSDATPEALEIQHLMQPLTQFNQDLGDITGQSESPYLQSLLIICKLKENKPFEGSNLLECVEKDLKSRFLQTNNNQADWNKLVTLAKVTNLDENLCANFNDLLKSKCLTLELKNIQRTKEFILSKIKYKTNMPAAELHAYLHELREIKAIVDAKKVIVEAKPAMNEQRRNGSRKV